MSRGTRATNASHISRQEVDTHLVVAPVVLRSPAAAPRTPRTPRTPRVRPGASRDVFATVVGLAKARVKFTKVIRSARQRREAVELARVRMVLSCCELRTTLAHQADASPQARWRKVRRIATSIPRLLRKETPAHVIERLNHVRAEALVAIKAQGIVTEYDPAVQRDGLSTVPYEMQGNLDMYTIVNLVKRDRISGHPTVVMLINKVGPDRNARGLGVRMGRQY